MFLTFKCRKENQFLLFLRIFKNFSFMVLDFNSFIVILWVIDFY